MPPVLAVERFALHRRGGFRVGVPGLQLQRGEAAVLYGPSGSGKTTVLQGLFGLGRAPGDEVTGEVLALGRPMPWSDVQARRHLLRNHVAWIQQDAAAALDPMQAVGEQIRQATFRSFRDCHEALADLGVTDAEALAARAPHQISGGQAQRVLFAVASLRQPDLVVADEPTASLDEASFLAVAARLRALRERGAAVLLAAHDHRLIEALGALVFVEQGGQFAPGRVERPAWPARSGGAAAGDLPVLRARGVRVSLGGREVLAGVDLDLHRGEILVLHGDSGAGKTTLLRVLAGHRRADAGTVERPMRPTAVQLLCQDAAASITPSRTLRSLLAEAHAPFFDAAATADALSLPRSVLDRTVTAMSTGERRRASLLRALAVHPDVLLLDEPTASLDHAAAAAVIATLHELRQQRGLALLLATHDAELAAAVGDHVVTLSGGRT